MHSSLAGIPDIFLTGSLEGFLNRRGVEDLFFEEENVWQGKQSLRSRISKFSIMAI